MKFFKAEVNGEPIYFKSVTWFYARDMGRMLYPLEAHEDCWAQMTEVGPPPIGENLHVYEREGEYKGIVLASGYEFDTVAMTKPKKAKKSR